MSMRKSEKRRREKKEQKTEKALTLKAECSKSVFRVKRCARVIYNGCPGGWAIPRFFAVVINSHESSQ